MIKKIIKIMTITFLMLLSINLSFAMGMMDGYNHENYNNGYGYENHMNENYNSDTNYNPMKNRNSENTWFNNLGNMFSSFFSDSNYGSMDEMMDEHMGSSFNSYENMPMNDYAKEHNNYDSMDEMMDEHMGFDYNSSDMPRNDYGYNQRDEHMNFGDRSNNEMWGMMR